MYPLQCDWDRLFLVRISKRVATTLLVIFVFDVLFFPIPSIANMEPVDQAQKHASQVSVETKDKIDNNIQNKHLPSNSSIEAKHSLNLSLTAYTSRAEECQGDPCITANGFNLCKNDQEDTIATNRLPLGTKVLIPELYGDKVFVVRDRMNKRYYNRADIWMKSKKEATRFGIKRNIKLVVLK